MNKKHVVAGVVLLAGLSGYLGMHVLEQQTEQAVSSALAAVPAKAGEIRYSFLDNTLTLKNVTYELSDEDGVRTGTVESVDVRGFNRGCLSTEASAYSADTLPLVAESIVIDGIADKYSLGKIQLEQKVADIRLSGWHQRLGMLLKQKSAGEAAFYEELYRYSLDDMEIGSIRMVLSGAEKETPVTFDLEKIGLSGSVPAPRGDEKVVPFSLYAEGIRFSGSDVSGSISGELRRMDLKDILLPDPAAMAELIGIGRILDSADLDTDTGWEEFDASLANLVLLLQKSYEKKLPASLFNMQGFQLSFRDKRRTAVPGAGKDSMTVGLDNFKYALSLTENGGCRYVADLDRFRVDMPELRQDRILKRYAPDGMVLNIDSETVMTDDEMTGNGRYELVGLGEMFLDGALVGNIKDLQNVATLASMEGDPFAFLQSVQIRNLNLKYKDSGLLAMAIELISRADGMNPDDVLNMLHQNISTISNFPNKTAQQLGPVLTEQFTMPGEFGMSLVPAEPVSLLDLFSMVMAASDDLPVQFSSVPGKKPLKDYLPKN